MEAPEKDKLISMSGLNDYILQLDLLTKQSGEVIDKYFKSKSKER